MTEKREFKSAKELGLTQKEWEALITTLTLLDNDAIVHVPSPKFDEVGPQPKNSEIKKPVFNMRSWRSQASCGTVMCIGGSAEFFGKLNRDQLMEKAERLEDNGKPGLQNLFYPTRIAGNWNHLTTKQAATALRHYLKTGAEDAWKDTLK